MTTAEQATTSPPAALVAFIRTRLDEDQQRAEAAVRYWQTWHAVGDQVYEADLARADRCSEHTPGEPNDCDDEMIGEASAVDDSEWLLNARAAHMARHDPTRVLADVAAKRRIVDECSGDEPGRAYYLDNPDVTDGLNLRVLCLLALPDADHPDYRPEWAPV